MNYIEVTFDITPYEEAVADALISELGTIGYDGFSYTDQGFTAYIPAKDYNAQAITPMKICPGTLTRWPELSYRNLGTGNRRPGLEQSMGRKFHSHRGRRPDLSQGRIPRSGSRHRI